MLEYEVLGSGKYDYVHTFTPPTWRGKGLSDIVSTVRLHFDHFFQSSTSHLLLQAAMDFIRDNNYKVALTCGYLATTFIEKHPEYRYYLLLSDLILTLHSLLTPSSL